MGILEGDNIVSEVSGVSWGNGSIVLGISEDGQGESWGSGRLILDWTGILVIRWGFQQLNTKALGLLLFSLSLS